MARAPRIAALLAATLAAAAAAGAEEFRTFDGHGGPVMSVAVDGDTLITASFDNAAGLWAVAGEDPPRWLDGHSAAVNAAIFLPGGRAATGSDDFTVILWDLATGDPVRSLEGHRGKVVDLAATADGTRLASASWDGTLRIWDTATGATLAALTDHDGPVNAVAWSADATRLYSASYDGTLLEWDAADWTPLRRLAAHGFGINVLALDEAAGWIAYGALDGGTRALDLATGRELADLTADRRPILALARAPDGSRIAVGDGQGYIMVVATEDWSIEYDFRAALNGPIWALAFTGSGAGVIAGGIADEAYLWPLGAGEDAPRMAEIERRFHVDPSQVSNGERQFMRKCSICHTLQGGGERRAGPPLEGLFGRTAGSVAGYPYSDAVRTSGLVWTDETIDALFDQGPEHYIPGTKMPMQRITGEQDRADLIDFLKRETKTE